ncbi:MAG: hypothetical protein IIW88_10935, partial [Clostridia bacterium]|nr:hypothetical protein [Clostridia bacterium]
IIEAIAGGYTKANEISTKIGEEPAKCLKYIKTLCELGIVTKNGNEIVLADTEQKVNLEDSELLKYLKSINRREEGVTDA